MSFGGLGVREKKTIFYDQIVFFGDFTNIYLWRRNLKHRSFGFLMEVLRSESEVTCTMVYPPENQNMIPQKIDIYKGDTYILQGPSAFSI